MLRGRLSLGALFLLLFLFGMGQRPPAPPHLAPSAAPRVSPTRSPAPADTLHASAKPGTPLILALPSSLQEQSVERYVLLRGPALSGVAGRSFTWIPRGAEPGTHEALLQARHPEAPPDTLVLRIDLQS